jgi:hypothetical protein
MLFSAAAMAAGGANGSQNRPPSRPAYQVYAPAGGRDSDTLKKPAKPTRVGDDGRLTSEPSASAGTEGSWWNPGSWFSSGCQGPETQKPTEAQPAEARTPLITTPAPVEMTPEELRAKRLARFG